MAFAQRPGLFAAVALAAFWLLGALAVDASTSSFAIKNALPEPMGVECSSEVEHLPPAAVAPGAMYHMDITWEKQSSWTCNISGQDSHNGSFLLWERRRGDGFPCGSQGFACRWVADAYGMSVFTPEGMLQDVYPW